MKSIAASYMTLFFAASTPSAEAFAYKVTSSSIAANAVAASDEIHLTILTDRVIGAAAALQSVCTNAKDPERLRFHIIGPSASKDDNVEDTWQLEKLARACAVGGAALNLYTLEEMTSRVEDAGFSPAWKWQYSFEPGEYSVHPAEWDNSATHNDPFNILRFYLPHIAPFKYLPRVLFMDDDVIIQKDVAIAWDYKLYGDNVLSASCHNWVWSDCDRFDSSTSLSYLDVPYLAIGRLGADRTEEDAMCTSEKQRECAPKGFLGFLANKSRIINGADHAVTLETLRNAKAFNYGFNKFDLNAWRAHDITGKFVKWMELNREHMLFPTTSLAYGLGVAMLAKIGHVQCFDDEMPVIQGLGFVGPKDMRGAGHYADELKSSFGLHFNGPHKPWDPAAGNPYSDIFLYYSQKNTRKAFHSVAKVHSAQRRQRVDNNRTSFVIITDPRSGSEWFMEMLDQHAEICASGEKDDSAVGFPREALIPARYHYMAAQRKANAGSPSKGRASMLQSRNKGQTMVQLRPNAELTLNSLSMLVENGTRRMHSSAEMHRQGAFEGSNYYSGYYNSHVKSAMKDGEEDLVGIRTCQAKAACSWGNIAPLLWHASISADTCTGTKAEWKKNSEALGFGMHLGMICDMIRKAQEKITGGDKSVQVTQSALLSEAFRIYFRQQMREQLYLNDAGYGSELEDQQLLPCRCPKSAVTTGQKLMNEWIGDLPEGGVAAEDWKKRPFDVNYNAPGASQRLGAPYLDMFGAMKEVGTAAIIFHRANLLARFVSLQTAGKSNIFHCDDDKCVNAAVQSKIAVDIAKLMHFIQWNQEVQKKNLELLQSEGIPVITISYEDCRMDTRTCIEKVSAFLNVKNPREDLAAMTKGKKLIGNLRDQIANADEVRQVLLAGGNERWIDDNDLSML